MDVPVRNVEFHEHQCGLTALGVLEGYGCGHVWSHATTDKWHLRDHYCPKCGKGPFTVHYRGGAELFRALNREAS